MKLKTFNMKYVVIISLLCLCMVGCSGEKTTSEDSEVATEAKTGSEDSENTSVFGNWHVNDYEDEFGDSTSSTFIYTVCDGTFENTATSDQNHQYSCFLSNSIGGNRFFQGGYRCDSYFPCLYPVFCVASRSIDC